MTFFRVKRVDGRDYVYEMRSYRDKAGQPRNEIVRYLGPASPVRKQPVDVTALRERRNSRPFGESPAERRQRKKDERAEARLDRELRKSDS